MGAAEACYTSARVLARLVGARRLSAGEVMEAHLEQIRRLNPTLNAIVAKLPDDRCPAHADEADARAAQGAALPPLPRFSDRL